MTFYENGKRKSMVTYSENKKTGKEQFFNEDGSKKEERFYKNGVLVER